MEVKEGFLTRIYDENGRLTEARSYDTCIATKVQCAILVNNTKYSKTTSRHQNLVIAELKRYNRYYELVEKVCKDATPEQLLEAWRKQVTDW